jgi:hypothetical protein
MADKMDLDDINPRDAISLRGKAENKVGKSADFASELKVSFGRTARIIMEGFVYVRKSLLI